MIQSWVGAGADQKKHAVERTATEEKKKRILETKEPVSAYNGLEEET